MSPEATMLSGRSPALGTLLWALGKVVGETHQERLTNLGLAALGEALGPLLGKLAGKALGKARGLFKNLFKGFFDEAVEAGAKLADDVCGASAKKVASQKPWSLGSHKSATKWKNQMGKRGWTDGTSRRNHEGE